MSFPKNLVSELYLYQNTLMTIYITDLLKNPNLLADLRAKRSGCENPPTKETYSDYEALGVLIESHPIASAGIRRGIPARG